MSDTLKYTYRGIIENDYKVICNMPQNITELYYMFPKADYPLSVEQLSENLKMRSNPTVFLHEDQVIGFANFYNVVENKNCSLGNVIVHPLYRKKGVGRFIVKTMEQLAVELYNTKNLHISCFNENTDGIILYHRMGYIPYEIEERENKNSKITTLIRMKRKLIK